MQFIIIHDKRLIIFWSPKCGCSTLKTILAIYFNIHDPIKYSHIHLNKELDKLIDKNEDNLKYKNYDLVFLIRNPYDRLASGFMNKYVSFRKIAKKPHYKSPDNCKSFYDFCHILLNNPKAINKHHFEPQTTGKGWDFYSFLGKPKIKYVFDTKDVNEIKKLLDLSIEDVKTNYTKKSEKSCFEKLYFLDYDDLRKREKITYSNFYNSTLKKIVYEIYKNDFDFFNNVLNMNYSI